MERFVDLESQMKYFPNFIATLDAADKRCNVNKQYHTFNVAKSFEYSSFLQGSTFNPYVKREIRAV